MSKKLVHFSRHYARLGIVLKMWQMVIFIRHKCGKRKNIVGRRCFKRILRINSIFCLCFAKLLIVQSFVETSHSFVTREFCWKLWWINWKYEGHQANSSLLRKKNLRTRKVMTLSLFIALLHSLFKIASASCGTCLT